jgi:hypothetical protein
MRRDPRVVALADGSDDDRLHSANVVHGRLLPRTHACVVAHGERLSVRASLRRA